ncbi:MAG: hypothetical protein JWQ16_2543 [Novosphingobium sp.]|nr:hypothetical protein [Novosphingobium sp.]
MTPVLSSDAAGILHLMVDRSLKLPVSWESDGFALESARSVAAFIAEHRGIVSTDALSRLLAAGGVLVAMAARENEAAHMVAGALNRPTGGSEGR